MLTIVKALNNNMVLVRDKDGNECICQGKGLGFQKRNGDTIAPDSVERKFELANNAESKHFQQLFEEIPESYWKIGEKIVNYAKTEQELKFDEKVMLPLCDHMAGSVERYKNGVAINNPMLWDIKRAYPSEFKCGMFAIDLLKEKFGVEMQEDEAAFLAYHFVNAELDDKKNVDPDETAKLISSIIQLVQESFQTKLDVEDWNYQRFLTHLKFFSRRVLAKECYGETEDSDLYEELSEKYKHINNCVNAISDYILINYHYEISTDERLYLLVHIQRVTKEIRKKQNS